MPAVYGQLTTAMANPGGTLKAVAEIVKRDVGLCSRVLQFANSAYCVFSSPLATIEAAVVRLGLNTLRHLALTVEAFSESRIPVGLETLVRHALLTGAIARLLVVHPQDQEVAFTAGLLHEMGTLVFLAQVPDAHRAARDAARIAGLPLADAERRILGASHADVAAYLLSLWDLPHALIEPIALQSDPCDFEPRKWTSPTPSLSPTFWHTRLRATRRTPARRWWSNGSARWET